MNLPTSEKKPDGFSSLPPVQKKRMHVVIKQATSVQRLAYLRELCTRSSANIDYFILLMLSSLILFLAVLLNSPLILFIAALITPFLTPLVGLAIAPVLPDNKHFLRSLATLAISVVVYFFAGWLAGMIPAAIGGYPTLHQVHLVRSTWLEWLALLAGAGITAWLYARNDETPRLSSALVAYLTLFPIAYAGMLYQVMPDEAWMAALIIGLSRLVVAAVVMLIVFSLAGLVPRTVNGWILSGLLLVVALVGLLLYGSSRLEISNTPQPQAAAPTLPPKPTLPPPTAVPTTTPQPPTKQPTLQLTATPINTPTITPAPISARVNASNGVIVRWTPNSKAEVMTYLNDRVEIMLLGEQVITDNIVWEKALLADGQTGWIMGTYLQTATPKP